MRSINTQLWNGIIAEGMEARDEFGCFLGCYKCVDYCQCVDCFHCFHF